MLITSSSQSSASANSVSVLEKPSQKNADLHVYSDHKAAFSERVTKDLNSGRLAPDANAMVDAVLYPGKATSPKVQVKTFAVNGIQANDILFIQRVPPVSDGPNIVLYVPEKDGGSFQTFTTREEMNTWLKAVAGDPQRLNAFAKHFAETGYPGRTQSVFDTMAQFKNNDINAVVGPFANEYSDIFGRLDTGASAPPVSVNGLSNLKAERESPEGRVLYSGLRPDGEKVYFQFDAYGNLLGDGDRGNFYFLNNGVNSSRPLVPLSEQAFKQKVANQSLDNVGANDIRGFYDELLNHLEHPFSGLGEALQVFGVNKNTADTVERYFDNPVSALLLDLNKNNQIGNVFGVDKSTMDGVLKGVGDVAQGFVPVYGQARGIAMLLAKAIRNEPMTDQEVRDLGDALGLKPDSPAMKNLPMRGAPGNPAGPLPVPQTAEVNTPIEKSPVTEVEEPSPAGPATTPQYPGIRSVSFRGENRYFAAETPDAGDGEHYLLRVKDPNDPTRLVSSGIIAKPDNTGVWVRRGTSGGGGGSSKSAAPQASASGGGSTGFLENLLKQRNETPGATPGITSVAQLKAEDFPVPARIYRAHTGTENPSVTGLRRAAGTTTSGDDYLAAIIKHTARQGGSNGEVMSFSTQGMKAESFARQYSTNNNKVPVYTVDTTQDPSAFRTVPDIILKDGERLVREGKITKATLLQAIDKVQLNEQEVFYVKGDVPPQYLIL
ncbi:dermonecrotic toxin domain-containing protein [Pseudomonas sp. SDO524_S393]